MKINFTPNEKHKTLFQMVKYAFKVQKTTMTAETCLKMLKIEYKLRSCLRLTFAGVCPT
jgi:hypothetical protein